MARMIPSTIDPKTSSPGEREIFTRLRDDPGTADWIALHSFNLPRHRTQVQGEADFVVLVPSKGMLCLEVKAHRRVTREADGKWRLGQGQPSSRSPFQQADDNMRSLQDVLGERRLTDAQSLVTWLAVVFTHCEFRVPAVEWNAWEVIDRRDLRVRPVSDLLVAVLDHARAKLPGKARDDAPTAKQCANIAQALRPRFEVAQPAAQRRSEDEEHLRAFTEEQFVALDGMAGNPRVVFEGPAGTGKTLLAIEAARRAAASGDRVGFLCFNRLLGEWLAAETASLGENVTTSTLHKLMLSYANTAVPREASADYFATELPELAMEALLDANEDPPFDYLVVDEAQDILRDSYLDFLDLTCRGGLSAGRWTMFGDFERQALFGAADVDLASFLAGRASAARFGLRMNCRNTPRIARWVSMVAGLDPPYAQVRRPDSGPPPRTRYYSGSGHQVELLCQALSELYDAGFEGRDIVVLSPRKNGAATQIAEAPWRDRIRAYDTAGDSGFVRFTTVHAFKGLEAPVVVLTDIEEIHGDRARALFYTATTRATDRLVVLAMEDLKDEMLELVDQFRPEETQRG